MTEKKAEMTIRDTRLSECLRCLITLFNHVTVLQAGSKEPEEKWFFDKAHQDINELRLRFLKFSNSREDIKQLPKQSKYTIIENPPEIRVKGPEELKEVVLDELKAID